MSQMFPGRIHSAVMIISSAKEMADKLNPFPRLNCFNHSDIQIQTFKLCSRDYANQCCKDTPQIIICVAKCKDKKRTPRFFSTLPVTYSKGALSSVCVSSHSVPLCSHLFTSVLVLALLLPLPMMLSHRLLTASAWIHSTPTPLHSTAWGQWSHLSRWGTDLTASRPVHWPSPWLSVSINGWSPLGHEVQLRHCGNMLR